MHAAAQRVIDAAHERGLQVEVREFPEGTRTAARCGCRGRCRGRSDREVAGIRRRRRDRPRPRVRLQPPRRVSSWRLRQVRPTARSGERTPTRFVPRRGSQSGVSRPSVTPRRCARSWTTTSSGTTKCGPRPGTPRHVFAIEPNELVRAAGGTVSSSLGAPDRA